MLRSFPNKTELLRIFETLLALKLNGFLWLYTSINDTVATESRASANPEYSLCAFLVALQRVQWDLSKFGFHFFFNMTLFQRIT
jgi:hypothetical protein